MASNTPGASGPARTRTVPVPPELAGDFAAFNLWRLEMSRDVFDHDPAMETVRTVWNRTEGQAEFTAIAAIPEPVDPYATADWNPFAGLELEA